ncbi:MAG TPA: hypothetical protein VJ083_01540 [Sedimentibacter sp.]|nr:hypothetical protein [Sedimentibacter sp.]
MVLGRLISWFKKIFYKKLVDETKQEEQQEIVSDVIPEHKPIKKINDDLSLYFGYDYVINDKIKIHQPTIGDIVEFGEANYFSMAQTLTTIPSDMKSILFDMGIDYEEVSDFELFIMLSKSLTKDDTYLLLGDIDLSNFDVYKRTDNDEIVMYDEVNDITIDTHIYILISNHIRKMHGFKKKIEKAGNEFTKKILIQEDRDNRLINKNKEFKSILKPLISSMVNSEGFKYKLKELKDVGLCEFMDSVNRISVIKHTESLLSGVYSGNIDQSKLKKSELNWMRELD